MARYIDADLLLDKIGTVPLWTGYDPPYSFEVHLALVEIEKQLKGIIKAIPTADVVEVVRCKDCKFKKTMSDGKTLACLKQSAYRKPTDFCSYSERKTG